MMERTKSFIGGMSALLLVLVTVAVVVMTTVAWAYGEVLVQHKFTLLGILVGALAAVAHLYKK